MISIIYYWQKYNKINGTLFYCYEYYKMLQQYIDVNFIIVNCLEDDQKLIYDTFKDKYKDVQEDIVFCKKIQLHNNTKTSKAILFLDVHSYKDTKYLYQSINKKVILFKDTHHEDLKIDPNIITFGIYKYQEPFDHTATLKLNFNEHKESKYRSI